MHPHATKEGAMRLFVVVGWGALTAIASGCSPSTSGAAPMKATPVAPAPDLGAPAVPSPPATDGGAAASGCSSPLIYLLGQDQGPDPSQPIALYTFDPSQLPKQPGQALAKVGRIPCLMGADLANNRCFNSGAPTSLCASLAIDRQGVASVFANPTSGPQKLFHVNILDGSCIDGGAEIVAQGFSVAGSAFTADGAGEKLYLSLEDFSLPGRQLTLGELDGQRMLTHVRPIAATLVSGSAPMTLSPNGHLFVQQGAYDVVEIDPSDTTVLRRAQVPLIVPADKWYEVFAFWGGDLYYFASLGEGLGNRAAFRVKTSDFSGTEVLPELGAYLFAATSGTCAPIM
jgi:hypothetical protein